MIVVPCINFRTTFNTLFWIYTAAVLALTAIGIRALFSRYRPRLRYGGGLWEGFRQWFKESGASVFLIVAFLVIAYQMCVYIFKMHLDEDDARWIAEANDALVKNRMLLHNPATGEYIGRFVGEMVKDVFSPWAMYLAWLSRMTGVKAVVIAHTVYPPILLGLSYSAYYDIGCQLFKGKDERGIFLLMVSVLNLFMAGNVYTQSVFTLTRIWQGKAVVAAVMIPAIFSIILQVQYEDHIRNWILMIVAGTSCCLFSGMGIAISFLLMAIYGFYVTACAVIKMINAGRHKQALRKGWAGCLLRMGLWIASMLPSIAYGLGYVRLKG